MAEVEAMRFGMKGNVIKKTLKAVTTSLLCSTLNVEKVSILLDVVFALLIVPMGL